jgi:hypothetical protein
MTTPALVAEMLARPLTHKVVTTWSDGSTNELAVRSLAQAKNHKITMSHMAGRDLISRETGATVRVTSIEIVAL